MAYNLRSRLTSEGSSVAPRSEGMNLSPVEFAVHTSEQTQTTAGRGLDPLEPVVIEGSPEALQTIAIPAPAVSQVVSDTPVESDVETDEQTGTLNTTIVPTPAVCLAADSTHTASSVCGAGAAGQGPPPSEPGAAPSAATATDPTRDPTYRDHTSSRDHTLSSDPLRAFTRARSSIIIDDGIKVDCTQDFTFLLLVDSLGGYRLVTYMFRKLSSS